MKKKMKKTKKIIAVLLIVFILLFLLGFFYLNGVVNPIIVEASEAKIKSIAQKALSSSVLSSITNAGSYDKMINYIYDEDGSLSCINVDTLHTNILTRQISSLAQTSLDNSTEAGIDVHLGTFTGMAVFANIGPLVSFELTPIGTVVIKFRSEFESAGINQTHHKIFIIIESSIFIILPTANPKIDVSTEMLLSECVIVGKIPSTYLQSASLDEMLNLVP